MYANKGGGLFTPSVQGPPEWAYRVRKWAQEVPCSPSLPPTNFAPMNICRKGRGICSAMVQVDVAGVGSMFVLSQESNSFKPTLLYIAMLAWTVGYSPCKHCNMQCFLARFMQQTQLLAVDDFSPWLEACTLKTRHRTCERTMQASYVR